MIEGQRNVWKEWARDYLRITIVQKLLSSLSMYFAMEGDQMKYAACLIFVLFIIGSGYEIKPSNEKLHSKTIDIQLKGIPVNVYGMDPSA